jgi:hypothetical protein
MPAQQQLKRASRKKRPGVHAQGANIKLAVAHSLRCPLIALIGPTFNTEIVKESTTFVDVAMQSAQVFSLQGTRAPIGR